MKCKLFYMERYRKEIFRELELMGVKELARGPGHDKVTVNYSIIEVPRESMMLITLKYSPLKIAGWTGLDDLYDSSLRPLEEYEVPIYLDAK